MRSLAILPASACFLTAGCSQYENWQNPEVAACEGYLKEVLKSPSSYKRVSFAKIDTPVSKEVLVEAVGLDGEIGKLLAETAVAPGIRGVLLTYDADNGFGSSIRNKTACYFAMDNIKNDDFALKPEQQARGAVADLQSAEINNLMGREAQPTGLCCLDEKFDLDRIHSAQADELKQQSTEGDTAMDADAQPRTKPQAAK